jgi:fermentation-respiration switch protein FrsA (DUF1100 family)
MRARRFRLCVTATLVALSGTVGLANIAHAAKANSLNLTIAGAGVSIDAAIYLPAKTPAPAILLAHGFGGSKDSVVAEAKILQSRGFVVLAWTARGFGNSTGTISMDSPAREVADVSKLIDYLAKRTDVIQDRPNDPRSRLELQIRGSESPAVHTAARSRFLVRAMTRALTPSPPTSPGTTSKAHSFRRARLT